MIIVRDIFQVKFGKAKDAIASWKKAAELIKRQDKKKRDLRILTDLVGANYYTLIVESQFDSLAEFESMAAGMGSVKEMNAWYQEFIPLVEGGRREILNVVQ